MKKTWVLVANASHAKLFENEKNNLHLIREFFHDASMLKNRDLVSDSAGSIPDSFGHSHHGMAGRVPPKVREKESFASELAECLRKGDIDHRFSSLYVIAPPQVLGMLREKMGASLALKIKKDLHKDLIGLSPEEIRNYLPPVL